MAFQGQVIELPIGQDGMNGAENLALVQPNQLADARNISYASGAITKDGGAAKFNAVAITGAPTIIGGWDWWPNTTTQRTVILASNGAAYKDTGAGTFGVTLKSGAAWGATTIPIFVEGGKEAAAGNAKLFIFTGTDQVQVLTADGATTADIAAGTRPADWATVYPTIGFNHEGRLWGGGGTNSPHRLYYSTTTDYEDFTGAGSGTINVFPGEGQRITAACSYKGLIIVWKYPRGIYTVDTSSATTSEWRVSRIASMIGGAGPRCFCVVDDDILFMDGSGTFHLLSGVQEFGNIGSSAVSQRVWFDQWAKNNLNPAAFGRVRAIYYPSTKEAHFALSSTGSTSNDRRIVWDFNKDVPRLRYNDYPNSCDLFMRQDSNLVLRPAAGDNAGFVWNLDQTARTVDGAGYTGYWKTGPMDLSFVDGLAAYRRKNGRFLELVITPKGSWNMTVSVYWDSEVHNVLDYSMGSTGATLGSFVLGTDLLAGGEIVNKKRRITGSGRRFGLDGTNSGASEDFALSKFYFYYDLGNDMP